MRGKKYLAMLIVIAMVVALVPTVAFATTRNVTDEANLRTALTDSAITDITITHPIIIKSGDLEIPAGKTVTIAAGKSLTMEDGSHGLTVNGEIIVAEDGNLGMRSGSVILTVNGEITVQGTLSVNSEFTVNEGGEITVQNGGTLSKLSGYGTLTVKGAITVESGGEFEIDAMSNVGDGGSITVNEGGTLTIKSDGQLNINSGAILDANGTLDITDESYFIVSGGGTATVSGAAKIDGTLQVDGTLTAESGTTVTSSGTRKVSVKNTVYWLADEPTMKLFVLGNSGMLYSNSDLSSKVYPDEDYAITLNANDGTFDKETIYAYTGVTKDDPIGASIPTPTRSGNYSFNGWSDGANTYSTAELQALIFTDDTPVTFDAVWRSTTPTPSYGTLSISTDDESALMIKSGDTTLSSNTANFSITKNALNATYSVALTDDTRLITDYEITGGGVTVEQDATNPAIYNVTVTNTSGSSSVVFSTVALVDITLVNATITGKEPIPATDGQDENTLVYTVVSGETVDIVADKPAEGKSFDGWTVTGDATLLSDTVTSTRLTVAGTVENDITVTAEYKDSATDTYSVIYSMVGKDATGGNATYEVGDTVTIHAGTIGDATFTGWTSSMDLGISTDAMLKDTITFKMPAEDVELTGSWKDIDLKEYTITFNSGNADTAMLPAEYTGTTYTQTMYDGIATKLDPNLYTADGYIFLGWTLTDGAGTADTLISDGAHVTLAENTNLYAYWVQNKDVTDILTVELSDNSFVTDNLDNLEIVIEELGVENFVKVLLGDVDITQRVSIRPGSLIITVPAEVLETLSAGAHELRIETTEGYILQTITILDDTSPATGDNSETHENAVDGFVVAIALLVLGSGCVLLIASKRRTDK